MDHLKSENGFWEALSSCIPEHTQRQLKLGDSSDPLQDWLQQADTAWRLHAESSALQVIALEAYRHLEPESGGNTICFLTQFTKKANSDVCILQGLGASGRVNDSCTV